MKKIFFYPLLWICLLQCCFPASAQKPDTIKVRPRWEHELEADFYFMKDEFIFLPMYKADRGWLHLEARYNYEDMNTFSAWFGYTFSGGKKFQYSITPMAGGIVGSTNGIAPGLELDFQFCGFELSSESEFVFDLQHQEDDFYYNWTDLTYAPVDWLWFGLSAQRTRLYQTKMDFQHGLLLGGGYKWFGLTGYLYNPLSDDPYLLFALTFNFPEE